MVTIHWLYSVWALTDNSTVAYHILTTTDLKYAQEKALAYKGVITRQEVIGDARHWVAR